MLGRRIGRWILARELARTSGCSVIDRPIVERMGVQYNAERSLVFRRILCTLALVAASGAVGKMPPRETVGLVTIADDRDLPAVRREAVRTAIRVYEPILADARIGGDPHTVARGCGYLATLYAALGDIPKAKGLLDEAEGILASHSAEARDLAWVYNNRALVLLENREYAEGLRAYRKAVAVLDPRRPELLGLRIITLEKLASTYLALGDAENSEGAYLEALELLRQMRLENTHPHHVVLGNLALLYGSMGDLDEARKLLEKLLRQKGLTRPLRFLFLNNLGQLLSELKLYPEAEARLLEASSIAVDDEERAQVLTSLAASYGLSGMLDRAVEAGEEAVRLAGDTDGTDSLASAIAMSTLATALMKRGELTNADRLFMKARNILSKEEKDEEVLIYVLRHIALVARRREQHERALALSREALVLSKKHLARMLAFGTEAQRMAYLRRSFPYDQLADFGEPNLLADAALSMKGAVLDSLLVERALVRRIDSPADQKQFDDINALKLQIMEKIARGGADVDRLERQLKKEQSVLTRRLAARQPSSQPPISLETLQASLRAEEVLVEILHFQRYAEQGRLVAAYGALIVAGKTAPRWVSLGDADVLDPRIDWLRKQFGRGGRGGSVVKSREDKEVVAMLRELHDLLWKPLAEVLPAGTRKVLLSPDGTLCFLPWAVLLDGDGSFLAERWQLTQVSAGRDLLRVAAGGEARGNTFLALADGGEDLPHSRDEVTRIRQTLDERGWRTMVLLGGAAAENDLYIHPRPGILHLATHAGQLHGDALRAIGARLSRNPMYRGYILLGGGKQTLAEWQRGVAVPFANDGILTAEEASSLDLSGTWLTVLSACDTGAGDAHAGEGVLGLRRGFALAGTKNLLFSLWPVRDDATAQFMTVFYGRLFETTDAATAFHETQVAELRRWRAEDSVVAAAYRAGAFVLTR